MTRPVPPPGGFFHFFRVVIHFFFEPFRRCQRLKNVRLHDPPIFGLFRPRSAPPHPPRPLPPPPIPSSDHNDPSGPPTWRFFSFFRSRPYFSLNLSGSACDNRM